MYTMVFAGKKRTGMQPFHKKSVKLFMSPVI